MAAHGTHLHYRWGLLNGNMGLSKTSAGELLDETNQANGMTVFGIIGGIGECERAEVQN
jgi:hypothetical protein